ncbi:hypothetical protein BGX34_001679 [Mortierella sp. NVP85]|nr:hypothetical protein BGX34_001679 [Mortierella sp. NVP85]
MPPRHNTRATTTSSTKTTTIIRAKKRKNADRSDEELDSDFDYSHTSRVPPPNERSSKSKVSRSSRQSQQAAAAPSTRHTEELESWRTELSELEDRGFVFTRKKTTGSQAKSSTTLSAKPGASAHSFNDTGASHFPAPNRPPTPEGTPSRDGAIDKRVAAVRAQNARQPKLAPSQQHRQHQQPQHTPVRNQESVVTIPMRETPTIQRNKDLRSASRRSSFNMRGKRASSIGNGFTALPHPSVDPKSFFRHIAADNPPPVRMKQLMAWCARKSIDSQRSNSQNALKVAKLIEEEALAMLIAGNINVSWYSRPVDTEPIRVVPKKPHHQNVENQSKLKECEAQIAKLRKEDEEWTRIISSFNTFHATLLDSGATLPPDNEGIIVPETYADDINVELLSADERSLFEKHCRHKDGTEAVSTSRTSRDAVNSTSTPVKDNNKWMKEMLSTLEKEVDSLQDTLYAASRFDKIARQYTDQVLEQIAITLDERQRPPPLDMPLLLATSATGTSTALGKGVSGLGSGPALKSVPSVSAAPASIPTIGSDSVDDPRQILRALSRLTL